MTNPTTGGFRLSKGLIIAGSIGLAALLIFGIVISTFSGYRSTMIAKENTLSQEYLKAQNNLSTYISTIRESLGVADRNTQALDQVLSDAVRGRYDGDTSAQPGGGQLFSAITEAYPDLTRVSINYEKVQTAVMAGRESFKNEQDLLLDMIRDYNTWREDGLYKSFIVGTLLGAPTDRLVAQVGDTKVRGMDALDKMNDIITTPEGDRAYTDGQMAPLDLGPTTVPASPTA